MWFKRQNGANYRPWSISAKLLIASSVITILGFSAVCVSVMLDMRHGVAELARQTSENLVSTIDSDISRSIDLYDLSLRAVTTNIMMPELAGISKPLRHVILFDHAATAKHFGGIQVFDVAGKLILDAATLDPTLQDRGDEEFFQVHTDNPEVGLFISRPMLYRGNYAIVLSRRINNADGSFAGVAAGSIRFSYFHELFGRLRLGEDDTITVLSRSGIVVMRTPFDLDVVGKDLSAAPNVKRVMATPSGWFSNVGAIDHKEGLYVWRDSTKPLVVVVGKPWDNIYSLWRREALRITAIVLVLITFVVVATLFLAREIGRRAQAEDQLEEMATTDALTGLKNRRKFDESIDAEWRRAVRQSAPVAMLMIDADHFKAYNDMFGHQAGDQVLIGIAICISDSVGRAGDCAARYGGEEFAVLLPGISSVEALTVAEKIRLKVEQWAEGPSVTTVSVGVASLTPNASMNPSALVQAADKALYEAKANGRNQSRVASTRPLSLVA